MKKSEELMKSQKNPEKIRKPENDPENNIIISYLISKLSIVPRNIVKTQMKSEDLRRIIRKKSKGNYSYGLNCHALNRRNVQLKALQSFHVT